MSNMKTDIQEIKTTALELFRNKEIKEAFDYLFENLDDDNDYYNDLLLLAANLNSLKRDRISNLITKKRYLLQKSRIYSSFTVVVNSLEEPYQEDDTDTYSSQPYYISSNYASTYTPNESLLIAIIILLILLVIGVIFIIYKLN